MLYDGEYYYQYDAEGNRVVRYVNTVDKGLDSNATDITAYAWDNDNQMTGVYNFASFREYQAWLSSGNLTGGGTQAAAMSYDPFGRMVQRSEGSTTENYVYDGANLARALNSEGLVTEGELTGPAVDQVFASEYPTASGGAGGAQGQGPVSWYLTDGPGSVRDVVRGVLSGSTMTANVIDHVIYDAYGNARQGAAFSTLPLPRFGFDGMRYDAATGFYTSMTRPYDPRTGDWVEPDWIGFLGGQDNLSEFVGNSPTNFIDPTGLAANGWLPPEVLPPEWLSKNPLHIPAGILRQLFSGGGSVPVRGNPAAQAANAGENPLPPDDIAQQIQEHDDNCKNIVLLNELTGQIHHPISKPVYKALERNPNLAGKYAPRDPRFETQAIDQAAHNGWQTWHRKLDAEASQWLKDPNNANATTDQFEAWLRWRYSQPDLKALFPNGF